MAITIFVIVMVAVVAVFAKSFQAYRDASAIQKDMERAQYAMNLMMKSIRGSDIVDYDDISNNPYIRIYDYSRNSNKCIDYKYELASREIISGFIDVERSNCTPTSSIINTYTLVDDVESMSFYVVPTDLIGPPPVIGRVTISMEICESAGCSGLVRDRVRIQSTVSLRQDTLLLPKK